MNLPAGQYQIFHVMGPDWVMLKNSDAHATAVLHARTSSPLVGHSTPKLVFNRYGEKYFLAQVWTASDKQVHTCSQSSSERALARSSSKPPETATVFAKH